MDFCDIGTVERPEGFFFARDPDGSVHVETGPTARQVLAGYRRATAVSARIGQQGCRGRAKFYPSGLDDWIDVLRVCVLWVAVRRSHYDPVHQSAVYDVEVDLTNSQVDEAARHILGAWRCRTRRDKSKRQGEMGASVRGTAG